MNSAAEGLKMVLCVRADLPMGKGKMVAQCCHAAVGVVYQVLSDGRMQDRDNLRAWEEDGAMKICLRVPDEETLLTLTKAARQRKLPHHLVTDSGHTQLNANTLTVLAIGPARASDLDALTGSLKLL